jgi:hypothetical protein
MVAPALAVISGLAQGYAQNKKNEQDRALAEMKTKIMLSQMKMQQEQTKLAQTWSQQFAPIMAQKISTEQGQQQAKQDAISPTEPTTVFGDSFNVTETPGAGVLDQMVGGPQEQPAQTTQFSPEQLAGLQVASGGKIPGIAMGGLQQRVRADERLERQGKERIDLSRRRQEFEEKELTRQPVTINGRPAVQHYNKLGQKVGEPEFIGAVKGLDPLKGARLQASRGAKEDMQELKSILFKKDPKTGKENVNVKALTQMSAPGGGIPFTIGREAKALYRNMTSNKLRIESGAAITDGEIIDIANRFQPSILDLQLGSKDRDRVIRNKLDRLDRFNRGFVEMLDPNKIYTADDIPFVDKQGNQKILVAAPKETMSQEDVNKALVEAMKKAIKD